MRKRINVLILAMLVMISIFMTSKVETFAADASVLYVAGCPSSNDGKHHMQGRSSCYAKNVNSGVKRLGMGGQCRYCYMLIVTENNMYLNPYQGMGWYCTRSAWGTVGNNFTMEVTSFLYNSSCTDSIGRQYVWE